MGSTASDQNSEAKQNFDAADWKEVPLYAYTNTPDPLYQSHFSVLAHKSVQSL